MQDSLQIKNKHGPVFSSNREQKQKGFQDGCLLKRATASVERNADKPYRLFSPYLKVSLRKQRFYVLEW